MADPQASFAVRIVAENSALEAEAISPQLKVSPSTNSPAFV